VYDGAGERNADWYVPSFAVTSWVVVSSFLKVTVVPAATWMQGGEKAIPAIVTVFAAVAVAALHAVDPPVVEVESPPQPEEASAATRAMPRRMRVESFMSCHSFTSLSLGGYPDPAAR
jgi:hypothetical protein